MGTGARLTRWLFYTGSRPAVTVVALVATYLLLGPIGHALLSTASSAGAHVETYTPLVTAFLSGDLLLVSIVVSVSSLFTSREQIPLGEQLEQIQAASHFRQTLEELVDEPISPAEPARFLQLVTATILSETQALADDADTNGDLDADIDALTSTLATQTQQVSTQLDDATTSLGLVLATLDYEYSLLANDLRRLRSAHGDDFAEADRDRIDRILELLRHFVTAREYFKSLYLSREFTRLSKHLVYLTLPVILLVAFVLLHDAAIPNTHTITTVVIVVALSPFLLLCAYTVRVALVTQRTRAAGQFMLEGNRQRTDANRSHSAALSRGVCHRQPEGSESHRAPCGWRREDLSERPL